MPPWLSPLCLAVEKNIQFGILVFLEVQEINLRGNMRDSKCDEYYEKVPSPLDPVAFFFEIFLPQPPVMFSTGFN